MATHNTPHLKEELKRTKATFQTLRDEIRVRMHLAGMEVKDEWNRIEPQVDRIADDLKGAGDDVTDVTRKALDDIVKRLKKLRASLS